MRTVSIIWPFLSFQNVSCSNRTDMSHQSRHLPRSIWCQTAQQQNRTSTNVISWAELNSRRPKQTNGDEVVSCLSTSSKTQTRKKQTGKKKGKRSNILTASYSPFPPSKKNCSYLFRRERRSVPKWAKPAKNGPRVSSWSSEAERACRSLVLSSSEILDLSSRARGRLQPAREREGWSACRETLTVYLKLSERGRVTFSRRQTQHFRRSALSE